MSTQITEAQKRAYSDNFIQMMQQKTSILEDTVAERKNTQAKAQSFDRVGATEARLRTSRHSDTYNVDTPHSRRWAVLATYDWGDMIDKRDKLRVITDPQGSYIQAGVAALNRSKDDVLIAALGGSATAGEEATTTVALPSSQKVAVGGTGLTPDKIRSTLQILNLNNADPDEPKFFIIGAKQVTDLLNEPELTSGDYVQLKALVEGKIVNWLGFMFRMCNRLTLTSSVRYCYAYLKNRALGFAVGEDIITRAEERTDKSFSVQCFAEMDLGAVRIEEEAVVEVACLES